MEKSESRSYIASKIKLAFSSLNWTEAENRDDMNYLWSMWVEAFEGLVEREIGTRTTRETSWGRPFDPNVRALCKQASITRSWYLMASKEGWKGDSYLKTWVEDRMKFIASWEKSESNWLSLVVSQAVKKGDVALWRLLSGVPQKNFRPMRLNDGRILTDPKLIDKELRNFHAKSKMENTTIPAGDFKPVVWGNDFSMKGPNCNLILEISDDLVVANVKKLKLSTVPDNILPVLVKLLFGSKDTVKPLADFIRAVTRTRIFPDKGKVCRQIFVWKGKGERNSLKMCRTITMSSAILKLCEACVKDAGMIYWKKSGFPCSYWGQFSGAPESIYIWLSTVECYLRKGLRPETSLTDVSRAFDRLCIKLYMRKLYDYGLPRQLIELVVEFISSLRVHLSWGDVVTCALPRGDHGVPQGSLEGMWNFSVYSDNIQSSLTKAVPGILVGGQVVRNVVYADDNSPINSCPRTTNLALDAIASQGLYNCFKFKPSKCNVIGSDPTDLTEYKLGNSIIKRAEDGLLLGAVINGKGISALEHVKRRMEMVTNAISQIKSWRTRGLPMRIAFSKLFKSKLLPRFTYAFALLHLPTWGPTKDIIRDVFDRALSNSCAFNLKPGCHLYPGVWAVICGFPPVESFLRQEKLLMAARLMVGEHKAGRIFRGLFKDDPGYFERDVVKALSEWSLLDKWEALSEVTLLQFKRKVKRVARRCWPRGLSKVGNMSWLYHNHQCYSGNVPAWADWVWPTDKLSPKYERHFVYLLAGLNPAGGREAICCHPFCKEGAPDTVYNHHFFECSSHLDNRAFFKESAYRLYREMAPPDSKCFPIALLRGILAEPCPMWVGLLDNNLFNAGIKLKSIHELHRIVIFSSISSWGRYYSLPWV